MVEWLPTYPALPTPERPAHARRLANLLRPHLILASSGRVPSLPLQMAPRKRRISRHHVVAEEVEDEAVDEAVEEEEDEAVEEADDEADDEAAAEDLQSQLKRILAGAPALPDSIALTHRLTTAL